MIDSNGNPFIRIYSDNLWSGGGSGYGSSPEFTEPFRRWLDGFLQHFRPRKVIDFGCGDWQSTQLIDWKGATYLGYDVVPDVIEANQKQHGKAGVEFKLTDPDFADVGDLTADLLIVKDVLQHWPLATCQRFLGLPWQVNSVLFINDATSVNEDIELGQWAPRNLGAPPFQLPVRDVFVWQHPTEPAKWPGVKLVQLWNAMASPRAG